MKKMLAVDFDSTINSYKSGWVAADVLPDPPNDGAIEALRSYWENFIVCIFSSRFNNHSCPTLIERVKVMTAVQDWLVYYGLERGQVILNADVSGVDLFSYENFQGVLLVSTKPPATMILDDRAIRFTGVFPSVAQLKTFRSWDVERKVDV